MEQEEARQSLQLVQESMAQARRAVSRAGTGYFFVVWGIVWLLGFLGGELLSPAGSGYLWMALDVFGMVGTVAAAVRLGRRVRSPEARRTGLRSAVLWVLLIAYGILLFWVSDPRPDRAILFVTLFVAFGYTIAGVWISTPLMVRLAITERPPGWALFRPPLARRRRPRRPCRI
jgi:bacteriorhodopsin